MARHRRRRGWSHRHPLGRWARCIRFGRWERSTVAPSGLVRRRDDGGVGGRRCVDDDSAGIDGSRDADDHHASAHHHDLATDHHDLAAGHHASTNDDCVAECGCGPNGSRRPGPTGRPGSPQVMSDPLPSGLAFAAVQPSFLLAQQLADSLASADWSAARALDPSTASLSDEAFVDGYGGLDRASLLLIDARPSGAGHEMLVVSVAVELDGSQTSLYCLTWIADPSAGTVDQGGGSKLTTLTGNVSPEAIRSDPAALGEVGRCVWS